MTTSKPVYYIKLINGEDVICQFNGNFNEWREDGEECYSISHIMKIVNVPLDASSIVLAMSDWFPGSHKKENVGVQKRHVIGEPFAVEDEKLIESYHKMVFAEDKLKATFLDVKNKLKRPQ